MDEKDGKFNIEETTYISTSAGQAESGGFEQLELETEENRQKIALFLYFSAIVACMASSVELGFAVVWISPMAKTLLSDDLTVNPVGAPITTIQLATISTLPSIGVILGTLVLGNVSNIAGRRPAMITMSLPIVLMKIVMIFATNVYMIYIPQLVIGICSGGMLVAGKVYLTEISEDWYRTKVVCFGVLGTPLGNVLSFLISSCVQSFKLFTLACSIPSMLYLGCLIIFLPETPVYLMAMERREEALEALNKLRNKNAGALQKELEDISFVLKKTSKSRNASLRIMFFDRAVRRAFIASLALHVMASTDGAAAISVHVVQIFDAAGSKVPNFISINILTVVQLFFSFVATQTSHRYGRKTLLFASCLGNTFSLISVGIFYYLKSTGFLYIEYISWWPFFGLILFYISNSLGIAPACWLITSEVFPTNVISMAMSLSSFLEHITLCCTIFLFPIVSHAYGIQWNFWFYGTICIIGLISVYLKFPETRGRSLIEIQELFRR